MGRPRKADRRQLLQAARQVLAERGASNLTLDAVANCAGVSKASVLYEFQSMDGLVEAFVSDRFETVMAQTDQVRAELEGDVDIGIHARLGLTAARRAKSDDRAVALGLIALMAGNPKLRSPGQAYYRKSLADVTNSAGSSRGALLAFLALEGLRTLDYLDFHQWSDADFDRILNDIKWLSIQEPENNNAETGGKEQ